MAKIFTITEGLENLGALKSGGQGSVYKARRKGEIITAIKILPTPISSETEDDKNFTSFQNEVQKLKKVNEYPNPNVVSIFTSGITASGNLPYIEMEYIEGPDLAELLKPPYDAVFTIKEAIKVADHLCSALAHCHRADVKHGDIKSNNVKFNQRTGNYILLDFGLSIMSDEQRRTSIRHAGAIEFMAPEQNTGAMLFETDIYSFGIILFELLSGTVPFPLGNKGEIARNNVMLAHMETAPPDLLSLRRQSLPDGWSAEKKEREMQVPAWLLNMIYRCLEKDPANRFMNGIALQEFIHTGIIAEEHRKVLDISNEKAKAQAEESQLRKQIDQLQERLAEKENRIEDLQLTIELKDKALYQFQYVEDYNQSKRKGISKGLFMTVLIIAFGLAGFTAYTNFPHAKTNTIKDTAVQPDQKILEPVDTANEKSIKKSKGKTRKGTPIRVNNKTTPGDGSMYDDRADPTNADAYGRKYKVISTAYLHEGPSVNSKRNPYMAVSEGVVTALDDRNNFIYVAVINTEGRTAKGWLMKKNLSPVN